MFLAASFLPLPGQGSEGDRMGRQGTGGGGFPNYGPHCQLVAVPLGTVMPVPSFWNAFQLQFVAEPERTFSVPSTAGTFQLQLVAEPACVFKTSSLPQPPWAGSGLTYFPTQ